MLRADPVVLDRIIYPIRAPAFAASVFAAVFRQKIRHLPSHPHQPLPVCLRRDAQDIPCDPAVNLEHGAQNENAPALRVQTLQHDVGTGQFQLFRQNGLFHILGQIRHITEVCIFNVISIILEAQRKFRKHMLLIVFQVVGRNAEHPGGERALPLERRQVGHDLQQNVLGRVLCIRKCPQHPQGKVEYQILHAAEYRLQGLFVPRNRLLDQCRHFFIRQFTHGLLFSGARLFFIRYIRVGTSGALQGRGSPLVYPRASHHGHSAVSQGIPEGTPSWPFGRFTRYPRSDDVRPPQGDMFLESRMPFGYIRLDKIFRHV